MNNLLITGGAGFIGANFVHTMLSTHQELNLVVLDALTYAGNLNNLTSVRENPRLQFVHGDICDQILVERLLEENAIDTIVHFAAESHVDRSISGPDAFIQANIVGTHRLLQVARSVWEKSGKLEEKRFHHVSTDEVYGSLGPKDRPFTETTPYAPNSPYAASKAASDHLVRACFHTYGLPVTTSNCSNNYGPYQFPEKLLPLCLLNILTGEPLPIYGDGQQIRDWLHVDDHSRGIALILDQGNPGETYNIGGNNEWANIDTVKLLCEIVDTLFKQDGVLSEKYPESPVSKGGLSGNLITFVTDRLGHDVRYAINAGKITRELGYRPEHEFRDGLIKTVGWYLENESWWHAVRDGSYRNLTE
ncbi:MAG: dTDP-glucose 4,6-dehydratase [Gammaproteobacteria bacterium]|nr:dTDP-glucose 4,6-dehydratase [Gammaproteobacteria bacterium]